MSHATLENRPAQFTEPLPSDWAIDTAGLRKSYGHKVAVADLTLQVPRGEVFGFLGPNGAGKSTAVKMLLGLVSPTAGAARILGYPPGDAAAMARIGFLPEHFRFHEWLQAAELLDLHAKLYGLSAAERRKRVPRLLEIVGLSAHAKRPLSGFSKGMLQRIGLAQALLAAPDLVFLDEPTSALDPLGRMLVRDIIRDLRARGTTVFLNSHLLSEVEATCDRVAFIREGRVLRTLRLQDLEAGDIEVELEVDAVSPTLMTILADLTVSARQLSGDSAESLPLGNAAARSATARRARIELVVRDEEMLPAIASKITAHGARLYGLTRRHVSLEQVFLDVVGREDSGQ